MQGVTESEVATRINNEIRESLLALANSPPSEATAGNTLGCASEKLSGQAKASLCYRSIAISSLEAGDIRDGEEPIVMMLTASIVQLGLLTPLLVHDRSDENGLFRVLDGRLRLEAASRLGHSSVFCTIVSGAHFYGELAAIDEKLVRKTTSAADCSEMQGRRTKINKALKALKAVDGVRAAVVWADRPDACDFTTADDQMEPSASRTRRLEEMRHISDAIQRIHLEGCQSRHIDLAPWTSDIVGDMAKTEVAVHGDISADRVMQNTNGRSEAPINRRSEKEIERMSETLALQSARSSSPPSARSGFPQTLQE